MRELPDALSNLFRTPKARESIGHVLNSRLSVIDELLQNGGVAEVPGMLPPPRRDIESRNESNDERSEVDEVIEVRSSNRSDHTRSRASSQFSGPPEEGLHTPFGSVSSQDTTRVAAGQPSPSRRTMSPPLAGDGPLVTRSAYVQLLDSVIRIARRSVFPHRDAVRGTNAGNFLPGFVHEDAFGTRTQGQMNHDIKIGAAGELFVCVFESSKSYLLYSLC
jgi:hypothetical protein